MANPAMLARLGEWQQWGKQQSVGALWVIEATQVDP